MNKSEHPRTTLTVEPFEEGSVFICIDHRDYDMGFSHVININEMLTLLGQSEQIRPGDVVDHIYKPELDSRKVIAVGDDWLWLDFQESQLESGEIPTPLPIENYRKVAQ